MAGRNTDFVPRNSSVDEEIRPIFGRFPLASNQYYRADGNQDENPTPTSSVQSKPSSGKDSTRHLDVPVKESSWSLRSLSHVFTSSNASTAAKSNDEQQLRLRDEKIESLREELHNGQNKTRKILKEHESVVNGMQTEFQRVLDDKMQEREINERKQKQYFQKFCAEQEEIIRRLQGQIKEMTSDQQRMQEQYDAFIRKQQEESFKQMDSARWLPSEGSKVAGDLDRIKRDMRSWAKGTSIKNMSTFQTLDKEDLSALMKSLSDVVLIENNKLPHGLSTPKSTFLLLNALLAHDVYTNLFRNPFFFLKDGLGPNLPRRGLDDVLEDIYHSAQASNQQDAHMWRSQTLRLLLPPLRNDSVEGEKSLHSHTEALISQVAERQASLFLTGPARHLITIINNDNSNKSNGNESQPHQTATATASSSSSPSASAATIQKLQSIYRSAATISYQLWTRRTFLKPFTLHDLKHPTFDIDNPSLAPHTLVHYDEHEDLLRGRPITVIVHPLLLVYGTDEGRDYQEQGRVWAPAEVWLDSK